MIEVGIAGASGIVGQHLAARLARHPWFRVTWLGGSHRSAGRAYGDIAWKIDADRPESLAALVIDRVTEQSAGHVPPIVFSALDADAAKTIEPALAGAGHLVISNARTHRMHRDVPLIVPEINEGSLDMIASQNSAGAIITNPNCSTIFLALALAPLRRLGLSAANVTTLQALSGAGHPGVASLDVLGNVIPFIDGEEEKIQSETLKILGASFPISAHTTRVPVIDGHTEMVSVRLDNAVSSRDLIEGWRSFRGSRVVAELPSAPEVPVVYLEEEARPQPKLDVRRGGGMTVSIGRLRPCPVLGWKFVALGHNLIRGAAGAAILNAELAVASGVVDRAGLLRKASPAR